MNYKVKVDNTEQANEVRELFKKLGFDKRYFSEGKYPQFVVTEGDYSTGADIGFTDCELITIDQLKDLVVLHRNDPSDATHEATDKQSKYFLSSDSKWYLWIHEMAWYEIDSPSSGYIAIGVKEYLDPLNNYELVTSTDEKYEHWIEVPDEAEYYANDSMLGNKITKFFKEGFVFLDGMWMRCGFNHADGDILWQRQKDDSVVKSASDNVREIIQENNDNVQVFSFTKEQQEAVFKPVRVGDISRGYKAVDSDFVYDDKKHAHYFVNVSDVDEIDFYEVASRFNVTDPCIQHILKKCLATGNRGHKDFHHDLQDIHDTAVRMLAIHGIS